MLSISRLTLHFTSESLKSINKKLGTNYEIPNIPMPMSKEAVRFIVIMLITEIVELMQTCYEDDDQIYIDLFNFIEEKEIDAEEDLLIEQVYSAVNLLQDLEECYCRHGINLTKVYRYVYIANIKKKKEDGTFEIDQNGKVLKPEGWEAPILEDIEFATPINGLIGPSIMVSQNIIPPKKAIFLSQETVYELVDKLMSSLIRLTLTQYSKDELGDIMFNFLTESWNYHDVFDRNKSEKELILDQADAGGDIYGYIENAFCKIGVNLTKAFTCIYEKKIKPSHSDLVFDELI